jgi:hypothetical protein
MSLEKRLADALAENPDRVLARVLLVALVAAFIAGVSFLLKFAELCSSRTILRINKIHSSTPQYAPRLI